MQKENQWHHNSMKAIYVLGIIGLCTIIQSCNVLHKQIDFNTQLKEIEIDKTEMKSIAETLGRCDDEFVAFSCGKSSGHESGWYTYKKLGLALCSVSYTPERQDGYINGIVRNIGVFDTTNLSVNNSQQQIAYYDQGYYPISKPSLELVFGQPDKIKKIGTVQYLLYMDRQIVFVFNRKSKKFIKLYITTKK